MGRRSFSAAEFQRTVRTDVWVLSTALALPEDPETIVRQEPGKIVIVSRVSVGMSAMQQAVREYRRNLLPAIFVIAQKVYASTFRFVLWNSAGKAVGERQGEIEAVLGVLKLGELRNPAPFETVLELQDWWAGRYNFRTLRRARNRIVHDQYRLHDGVLTVRDDAGAEMLGWREADVLAFAEATKERAALIHVTGPGDHPGTA